MRLVDTTDAALNTDPVYAQGDERDNYRLVQVKVSSAATVNLQGRMDSEHDWHTIETYTATTASSVLLFPQMRVSITGNTGTVIVDADFD